MATILNKAKEFKALFDNYGGGHIHQDKKTIIIKTDYCHVDIKYRKNIQVYFKQQLAPNISAKIMIFLIMLFRDKHIDVMDNIKDNSGHSSSFELSNEMLDEIFVSDPISNLSH